MTRVQLSFVDLYCSESIACDHKMAQLKALLDGVEFDEEAWYKKVTDPRGALEMCKEARDAAGLPLLEEARPPWWAFWRPRETCSTCAAFDQCDWAWKDRK